MPMHPLRGGRFVCRVKHVADVFFRKMRVQELAKLALKIFGHDTVERQRSVNLSV